MQDQGKFPLVDPEDKVKYLFYTELFKGSKELYFLKHSYEEALYLDNF